MNVIFTIPLESITINLENNYNNLSLFIFWGGDRFGTTLKKHEHNNSPNRRRRRRHISKNDTYTSLATSVNHHPHYAASDIANGHSSTEIAEQEDEWDVGDLSKLDFSQVFADDEADYDSSLSASGGLGGGGFLGRRAQHLVNLLAQPDDCLVRNILQIWDSDLERIKSLDQRQILADINAALLRGLVQVSLSPLSSSLLAFCFGISKRIFPVT